MSCDKPLLAYRRGTLPNGKADIIIRHSFEDINPKFTYEYLRECIDKHTLPEGFLQLPCGQCFACRLARSRDWANRMMMELPYHDESYFLTLTYNDANVPRNPYEFDEETGEILAESLSLNPKDLQLFMKRLRDQQRYHHSNKIKFYACGEYGSQTERPHYHLIVFGLKLTDKEPFGHSDVCSGAPYFTSKTLERLWPYGYVGVANVTWETCAYVARYVTKKRTGQSAEYYEMFNLVPEFSRMSHGIGERYYEEHRDQIYEFDRIHIKTAQKGISTRPPRYYDKMYDIEYHDQLELLKKNRVRSADRTVKAKMEKHEDSYFAVVAAEKEARKKIASELKRKKGTMKNRPLELGGNRVRDATKTYFNDNWCRNNAIFSSDFEERRFERIKRRVAKDVESCSAVDQDYLWRYYALLEDDCCEKKRSEFLRDREFLKRKWCYRGKSETDETSERCESVPSDGSEVQED